jgi:NADPH:quinone reductase-like Zn-dependent oxidoreductase
MTSRAIRVHGFGDASVLTCDAVEQPSLRDDDVLVRVHATSVNPLDIKMRAGAYQKMFPHTLPMIPGWDVSGVVEAVGKNAKLWRPGDAVYGRPDFTRDGAYADYLAVKETELARKPETVSHVHAAAVPLAALTAWQALFDLAKLEAGQRVLVHAAAGGVGLYAVQLAKWKGAYVIGTASANNRNLLHALGADEVVDYTKAPFENSVRDVDVVFNLVSGGADIGARSCGVLKKGGFLVSAVDDPAAEAAKHGMKGAMVRVKANGPQLDEIAKLVDAGMLKPFVGRVLPLEKAAQAHTAIESRHTRGKIVLRVAGNDA